jgi:ABC-type multidrug transport system ATPase subunit
MGSSGAGKTTLMNMLADRVNMNGAALSGEILFNDSIPVNRMTFSRYGVYLKQEDFLFD